MRRKQRNFLEYVWEADGQTYRVECYDLQHALAHAKEHRGTAEQERIEGFWQGSVLELDSAQITALLPQEGPLLRGNVCSGNGSRGLAKGDPE